MSVELMNRMREEFGCPECDGIIVHNLSESYCVKCGLVVDDCPVDDNDVEKDGEGNFTKTRTGPPLKMWELPSSIM